MLSSCSPAKDISSPWSDFRVINRICSEKFIRNKSTYLPEALCSIIMTQKPFQHLLASPYPSSGGRAREKDTEKQGPSKRNLCIQHTGNPTPYLKCLLRGVLGSDPWILNSCVTLGRPWKSELPLRFSMLKKIQPIELSFCSLIYSSLTMDNRDDEIALPK